MDDGNHQPRATRIGITALRWANVRPRYSAVAAFIVLHIKACGADIGIMASLFDASFGRLSRGRSLKNSLIETGDGRYV